jgi:hypothetical protein
MKSDTTDIDPLDRPIFGAAAIAKEANLPKGEVQAFYMLSRGYIDGTKVGNLWTSTRRRIQKSLGISTTEHAA